ncbi:hypothetical protein L6654_41450 [Bradyrhizobium sp. WYCCWR 13023]|uniref:Uncharacterized protein n=1 Tax=Bradyrhizobium zhengyangense TaxID=2911009 RepID=A0A9X1UCC5_9BRAD|nr:MULTISPECIES: hypothetical protein [Bradyrhizobium]MCG2633030.1 hypothetical protein [Bradyrhizobium zhengyangense]MCG2673228.1 hypothetical protein [Bradyrhizobium zhengyangense]MDA9520131.1 hypothetical protein [Bradyrhizobium sp. CCBAU 11434]
MQNDMRRFISAMLDCMTHCATEATIDREWRTVNVADMRDAYDLLIRKLARIGPDPLTGQQGALLAMAFDDDISELQHLLADCGSERDITDKLQDILKTISYLRW